jgi:hypothetical protein
MSNIELNTVDKVKKILSNSKPDAPEDEILSLLPKAHKAVTEHSLELLGDNPDTLTEFGHLRDDEYYEESWLVNLWTAVSRYYYCTYAKGRKSVQGRRSGKERIICVHTIIGRKQNVISAKSMATFLTNSVRIAAKEAARAEAKKNPGKDTRPFENEQKRVLGNAMVNKVKELYDDAARGKKVAVYDSENQLAQKYLTEFFEKKELIAKIKASPDDEGFIEGYKAKK